nr:MAG TPA: tRNA pseudouridine synthase B [Caudoviricetes sp.]
MQSSAFPAKFSSDDTMRQHYLFHNMKNGFFL